MVERDLAKVEVAGSSPVIRSMKKQHTCRVCCFFIVWLRAEKLPGVRVKANG